MPKAVENAAAPKHKFLGKCIGFVRNTAYSGMRVLIEPRLMGRRLNLSPLVIILSLAFWGMIWGVVGMILCIPIMVILMIICGHFGPTRPLAIMLSSDGEIDWHAEAEPAP